MEVEVERRSVVGVVTVVEMGAALAVVCMVMEGE
jgi:hypothetical protein